jgi:hypothetical protein
MKKISAAALALMAMGIFVSVASAAEQSTYTAQENSFNQETDSTSSSATTIMGYSTYDKGNYDVEVNVNPDLNGSVTSQPFSPDPTAQGGGSTVHTLSWSPTDDLFEPAAGSWSSVVDSNGNPVYYSTATGAGSLAATISSSTLTFTIEGNTEQVSVNTASPAFTIPNLEFTSGTWSGSGSSATLNFDPTVNPGAGLTFNLNSFAGYDPANSTYGGAIKIKLLQNNGMNSTVIFQVNYYDIPALANEPQTTTAPTSYTIPNADLIAGDSYTLVAGYTQVMSENVNAFTASGLTDPLGASLDTADTFASIYVVPEPPIETLLLTGIGVLAFVHRRRLCA